MQIELSVTLNVTWTLTLLDTTVPGYLLNLDVIRIIKDHGTLWYSIGFGRILIIILCLPQNMISAALRQSKNGQEYEYEALHTLL